VSTQVEAILSLRGELMEVQEKLRNSESDKIALEGDILGLRDQARLLCTTTLLFCAGLALCALCLPWAN
jgi:hypothetical protein